MKRTRTFSRAAAAVFAVILTVSLPAADIRNHSTWRDTQGNIALNEQWLIGPDGKRVPAELSCQLWLPVAFDPDTGIVQMQHVKQWDPWVPATTTRRTDR